MLPLPALLVIEQDDERVDVPHPTAGEVVGLDKTKHDLWRRNFGPGDGWERDSEGDTVMENETQANNKYAPFTSETDWRIACWAVQEGIGQKSLDWLLAIPKGESRAIV
ncbi:hypothetical protein BJ138DRAFT_1120248 [Hygrophoropsis aurantiaca]|uniref:Uncharacterized protein n=1 Tax=Hygrophoropsis aurantiaca TaxID=72124 RepID=A0ACB7ZRU9_9AGAM|nr:hypothetical protein BJ138DRAFT_1120248 [Hygrophoropsis aurantiaca]